MTSDPFDIFIVILILLNTIFLAIEYEGQSQTMVEVLDWGNTIFTMIFAIEMVLKLLALGFLTYVKEGFNVFDALIVIVSLLEYSKLITAEGVTVLRAFRLLRILRLVKKWK